ncbi:SDR family NAD(P)-dependent oxidoreductase [Aestuariimicrobium sp. T2.26MG-19.2B]|uniref:SDR family NAD(P)-dependent oxidoreductase n=1 Tax=Aestuariimicrobium sp. T2.26MG-19.2B TaxID=3040679 RepID=UPI0024774B07|nr:SDR family oxidoreductase [Aestuariimicrobium sp. T2.26MG-19.2B]CAI9400840.1 Glucose 1-dehydrogenase [Aestuariimicrobium sp. T2.26MG-19.2B]
MNRSVVVTGAAQGIGRGIAAVLVEQGWSVVGLDVEGDALSTTASDLGITGVVGDVRSRVDLTRAATRALELAPLRGWVNNAGVEQPTSARSLDEAALERIVAVNLGGTLRGCAVAVEQFLAHDVAPGGERGSIVNISSIHAGAGFPDSFVYAATKGGIDALTRQLAVDEGAHGIRTNAVRPGAVMTPLTRTFLDASDDPEALLAEYAALHPQGRLVDPREVGTVVAFLLGPDSAMVNGQSLGVDGGASARVFAYPPHD